MLVPFERYGNTSSSSTWCDNGGRGLGRVGGWRWASGRLRPRVPCRAPLACLPHRWPSHARLPLSPTHSIPLKVRVVVCGDRVWGQEGRAPVAAGLWIGLQGEQGEGRQAWAALIVGRGRPGEGGRARADARHPPPTQPRPPTPCSAAPPCGRPCATAMKSTTRGPTRPRWPCEVRRARAQRSPGWGGRGGGKERWVHKRRLGARCKHYGGTAGTQRTPTTFHTLLRAR